jgi:hypothetical protein
MVAGSTDWIVRTATTKLCQLTQRRVVTLRRVMAIACALAFLLAGFSHAVQHVDAAAPVIALQMHSDGSDNSLNDSGKIEIGIDHCHGCVTVAIPVAGEVILPGRVKTAYPAARLTSLHPHSPIAETPPPIFEI